MRQNLGQCRRFTPKLVQNHSPPDNILLVYYGIFKAAGYVQIKFQIQQGCNKLTHKISDHCVTLVIAYTVEVDVHATQIGQGHIRYKYYFDIIADRMKLQLSETNCHKNLSLPFQELGGFRGNTLLRFLATHIFAFCQCKTCAT